MTTWGYEMGNLRDFFYSPAVFGLIPGLQRYIDGHVETGSFLRAVLENDLRKACAHADPISSGALCELMIWLDTEAPEECWGSPEKVKAWLARRESE
jgi:hypothetical protein